MILYQKLFGKIHQGIIGSKHCTTQQNLGAAICKMKQYKVCIQEPRKDLAVEAGKGMHSVETEESAAVDFLNSVYVLDRRYRVVKYNIQDNGPNGSEEVHFVIA